LNENIKKIMDILENVFALLQKGLNIDNDLYFMFAKLQNRA
jgi:hypothetical protein